MKSRLHVVAAVISDDRGRILLAKRPKHVHQGGLWEFPGGKVEGAESSQHALERELQEELGITPKAFRPLIKVAHDYSDRRVLLDVWLVSSFNGDAHGAEGQDVLWAEPGELEKYHFPSANRPIVMAATLPASYLITPEPGLPQSWDRFLERLDASLQPAIKLVQFRAKELNQNQTRELGELVLQLCRSKDSRVLLNGSPELAMSLDFDGVHLTSRQLHSINSRPLAGNKLVGVSCHNGNELRKANEIGCDFAVLGPVNPTSSHPGAAVLDWEGFGSITQNCDIPVYALGGMTKKDYEKAWAHGAQGIAAIRSLWSDQ